MARKRSVRYYPTRKAYYTTIQGQLHKLAEGPKDEPVGPTYTKALAEFKALTDLALSGQAGDCNTVRTIFELYAEHQTNKKSEATAKGFKNVGKHFVRMFGDLRINQLKRHHCEQFLDWLKTPRESHKGTQTAVWKNTRLPLILIKAAFNWAVEQEYITRNPFKLVKNVPSTARGEEAYVQTADFDKVRQHYDGDRRAILEFLWHTGCRPNEAYNVQVKDYVREDKAIVYRWNAEKPDFVWKNARKKKQDRVILLDDEMVALVERKVAEVKTGYLFKSNQGGRFTNISLGANLRRMKDRFGIDIMPYSIRHTYATRWLLNAGSVKVLADLLGTSVAMIESHYGHTMIDKNRMRELMMRTMKNGV